MCLIIFSLNQHPKYKLILAANRDEFFTRESMIAHHWEENDNIIGGKDMISQGTWLGINSNGRFIAITNYRDLSRENKNAKSRGYISKRFLLGDEAVEDFIKEISEERDAYNGFNLLLSENGFENMIHYSNVSNKQTQLRNGLHGLSNALLNTPWPKVVKGKKMLSELINAPSPDSSELIELLRNSDIPPNNQLPETGISRDLEKKLSPVFISMNGYGTRCSSAVLVDYNNSVSFHEVTYSEKKEVIYTNKLQLQLKY